MIKATIKFNSDFHIGSGVGKAGYIDSLFVKNHLEYPVIPGQTLKGIIRDSCQRIANSFDIKCSNKLKCPCLMCRIFGRESQHGNYVFSPAYLKTEAKDKEYPVRKRTSIDREIGTAKQKALFSTEVAPQNLEFEFLIKPKPAYKPDELELILLKAGILWIREIGGNRRRGLGHCRTIIKELKIDRDTLKRELVKLKNSNDDRGIKDV